MKKRNSLLSWLIDPAPPSLGIELRTNEISIVRLNQRNGQATLDSGVTSPLPSGCVACHMSKPNILNRDVLKKTIATELRQIGGLDNRRLALTLPDYVSRISVVELKETPKSKAETLEMLKFSLKKLLPFEISDARLVYEQLQHSPFSFLTGVMNEAIVTEYEEFFEEQGFDVGIILPTSISLLRVLDRLVEHNLSEDEDYFFVNLEQDYFTVSLVQDRNVPVLTRTLGLQLEGEPQLLYTTEDLVQEIIPTAIYYQEKLKRVSLKRIYFRSLRPDFSNLQELFEEHFKTKAEPFNLTNAVNMSEIGLADTALANSLTATAGAMLNKYAQKQ